MSQVTSINPISPLSGKDAWTVAREVADSAGELLLEWWPKVKEISDKGQNDIVTNVDKAAEVLIRDELAKHFPAHGFYGEELKGDQVETGFVWVVFLIWSLEIVVTWFSSFMIFLSFSDSIALLLFSSICFKLFFFKESNTFS